MFAYIFRINFIFLWTIYISFKIQNYSFKHRAYKLNIILCGLILTTISYYFSLNNSGLTYILPLTLLWLLLSFKTSLPQISFISTIIGFVISNGASVIVSSFILILISPLYFNNSNSPHLFLAILTAILQSSLCVKLFKLKRFNKGIPFLFLKNHINIITFICVFVLTLITPMPDSPKFLYKLLIVFSLNAILFFLIHWWQAQITKSYKQALAKRELESLRTELAEKDKLLVQLTRQNEELGRLIHQDNKRIPAMEHAVCEYLVTDFENTENALSKGNALLLEIKELSQNRSNSLAEIYANKYKHHDTGISSLDTMLNYMEKRASQEQIQFSVNIAIDLKAFISNMIDTNDLTHVLSDLLENAMIATAQSKNPAVQLQFYLSENRFVLEVADNGIPFETISLVNFGLTQLTTHGDTGGSGIGLMDIWRIKEKYAASLHISEYNKDSTYSKKIALIFDKKHRYSVSSYRKDELLQLSKRTDLQIF